MISKIVWELTELCHYQLTSTQIKQALEILNNDAISQLYEVVGDPPNCQAATATFSKEDALQRQLGRELNAAEAGKKLAGG